MAQTETNDSGLDLTPWKHLLLAAVLTLVASCDYLPFGFTPVGDIVRNPAKFEGQEVRIKGTVADALKIPLLDIRVFTLDDGTGQVPVATDGIMPGSHQKVAVRGRVESAAIIGGQSIGLHVTEIKRLPSY